MIQDHIQVSFNHDPEDIVLTADWHLWLKDRENINNGNILKRDNFDKIIDMYSNLHTYKFLIHMGDLTDDEMDDPEQLISVMKKISCKKILIRGNNDAFDLQVYKKCGFEEVYDNGFIFNNMLFTHMPEEHDTELNVHGHYHGCKMYWNCPFDHHVDIWNIDRTPIKYNHLQKLYDEYRGSGIMDISGLHLTGKEFKEMRGHYNGKKKEEF